jgi:hypothetical protein
MGREMKPVAVEEMLARKAKQIMEDFSEFTDGIRLVMLIHRAKEGAKSANNDKVHKVIVTSKKDFEKAVLAMLMTIRTQQMPYRIYASVGPRDMKKAIRKFKYEQLDADYYGEEDKESFYLDIFNRWFGCLAQPGSAAETYFVVDLDSKEEDTECLKVIDEAKLHDYVVKRYYTKNGVHIVMKPFNPALLGKFADHIHKDGLVLLHF